MGGEGVEQNPEGQGDGGGGGEQAEIGGEPQRRAAEADKAIGCEPHQQAERVLGAAGGAGVTIVGDADLAEARRDDVDPG